MGVTGSERDYGWDYVVEVFRNGTSTALTFNAQLKRSLHTAYSSEAVAILRKPGQVFRWNIPHIVLDDLPNGACVAAFRLDRCRLVGDHLET